MILVKYTMSIRVYPITSPYVVATCCYMLLPNLVKQCETSPWGPRARKNLASLNRKGFDQERKGIQQGESRNTHTHRYFPFEWAILVDQVSNSGPEMHWPHLISSWSLRIFWITGIGFTRSHPKHWPQSPWWFETMQKLCQGQLHIIPLWKDR